MSRDTSPLRELAGRLIAFETRKGKASEPSQPAVHLVCEKLHAPLATLMGRNGFRALLARSVVLARAEVAGLRAVEVQAEGTLAGWEAMRAARSPQEFSEGQIVLIARMLGLLTAFIGERLAFQILRETGPQLTHKSSKRGIRIKK